MTSSTVSCPEQRLGEIRPDDGHPRALPILEITGGAIVSSARVKGRPMSTPTSRMSNSAACVPDAEASDHTVDRRFDRRLRQDVADAALLCTGLGDAPFCSRHRVLITLSGRARGGELRAGVLAEARVRFELARRQEPGFMQPLVLPDQLPVGVAETRVGGRDIGRGCLDLLSRAELVRLERERLLLCTRYVKLSACTASMRARTCPARTRSPSATGRLTIFPMTLDPMPACRVATISPDAVTVETKGFCRVG